MEKVALVPRSLVHLHLDAMSIGPRVLTDTGHLPGNLDVRLVGLDGKAAIRDFRTNDRSRKLADDVPLGKLYTERLVPADENIRMIVVRLLQLRASTPLSWRENSPGLLLPRPYSRDAVYRSLRRTLLATAHRAGGPQHVVCHQLRHTFASEMVRLGISLPALMHLLGHKDIRMTLRYVTVTQIDLQREFHQARQNASQLHRIPNLSLPPDDSLDRADLCGIGRALATTRHLLEMEFR
jgi:hypothetical protein